MTKAMIPRLYTHMTGEMKRPYVEDQSLQLFFPDAADPILNVRQLYNSFKFKRTGEYEELEKLELEFATLQSVAKDLRKAYEGVISRG